MANHSSILAWRIPRTGEPGGLQSMGSQRVRHDWAHSTHSAVMVKENKLLQMAAASIAALRGSPSCLPSHKKFSKISRCVYQGCFQRSLVSALELRKKESEVAQWKEVSSATPWAVTIHPWDFPGKSTGVGCHFLLQVIFPAQESHPGLPHCRQMLYQLSHQRRTQNTCDFACGPLRTECLFPIALWLSQAPLVLKPDILRAFPGSGLLAEEPTVELGPLTPCGAPLQ